ncbi:hypothetical protein AQUCO_07200044v1 [Aquilegia coerulea]|uniref:F-box domain-containing protein n=1 Tax=Aquilegia coerulea TaxID=218851 RepID=A0A2G5CA40_AQUCA|nr:hypothetical protein AQUCO_07200044v1 [Aquilegia coerulea]
MAERFPEEVVMEILSRLPVKPLLRFRCVSKSWFRLLTMDSHFIKLHLNQLIQANPMPMIMYLREHRSRSTHFHLAEDYTACNKAIELDVLPFNMEKLHRKYLVSGICNGLLCLSDYFFEEYSKVYIWNPLTKDHIIIPCSPIPSHTIDDWWTLYSFGYHQVTNEFKVIRIMCTTKHAYTNEKFQSHVSVYTLGTGSWRIIEPMSYDILLTIHYPALVNGALHWLAARPGSTSWNLIVSFDLKDEVFREIPLPREYGVIGSWSIQYKIGQPNGHQSSFRLEPLGVASSGEIVVRADTRRLIVYSPKTNSVKRLKKFAFQSYHVYAYIGSIVSPRLINATSHIIDTEES